MVGATALHRLIAEPEFLGANPVVPVALAVKSDALLFASVQPPPARTTEVVVLGAGVGPDPSNKLAAAPYPTKSTTFPAVVDVIRVLELVRAIFAEVTFKLKLPIASADTGRATPLAVEPFN
jgi:hypothetical protein